MKSILAGLTLTLWILWFPAYTQTEETYCLPLGKARLLVADAMRLRIADSLNNVSSARIDLLDAQLKNTHSSFTNLLNIEKDKNSVEADILNHTKALLESYKSEAKENRWQATKFKILAILEAVGMVVLVIVLI